LDQSLYGHKYAEKLFYKLICKVLVSKLGFCVSDHDHCLFIRSDGIIVTWIDNAIIITKESGKANAIIEEICKHDLDLGKQGDGGHAEYLGIDIHQIEDGSTEMTQCGLIKQVIKGIQLQNVNPKCTPVVELLAKDKDGPSFNGCFNYWSAVGMLLYLANTTHPDISYAVNQCAKFSNNLKESHATALKCIGCY